MNSILELTSAQLNRAADLKEKIAKLERKLVEILGAEVSAGEPVKKRKGMSAAGRARVAAAQKARWAKIKGTKKA
jgi:hypothetical protein